MSLPPLPSVVDNVEVPPPLEPQRAPPLFSYRWEYRPQQLGDPRPLKPRVRLRTSRRSGLWWFTSGPGSHPWCVKFNSRNTEVFRDFDAALAHVRRVAMDDAEQGNR